MTIEMKLLAFLAVAVIYVVAALVGDSVVREYRHARLDGLGKVDALLRAIER